MTNHYILIGEKYQRMGGGPLYFEIFKDEDQLKDYLVHKKGIRKNEDEIGTLKDVLGVLESINGDGMDYIQIWKVIFDGLRKIRIV